MCPLQTRRDYVRNGTNDNVLSTILYLPVKMSPDLLSTGSVHRAASEARMLGWGQRLPPVLSPGSGQAPHHSHGPTDRSPFMRLITQSQRGHCR